MPITSKPNKTYEASALMVTAVIFVIIIALLIFTFVDIVKSATLASIIAPHLM